MKVSRSRKISGRIKVPGDKSVSHRAAIMGAVAAGDTVITNYSTSADCLATLKVLSALGAGVARSQDTVTIQGRGLSAPVGDLDCENSGTSMRLLTGLLAAQPFTSTLVGDRSLSARPMGRVIEPLRLMGASIESRDGRAPLTIHGGRLHAVNYRMSVASAQVKSCVLLAGLFADGTTTVVEPVPTRDHTERMLGEFGVELDIVSDTDGARAISLNGGSQLRGRNFAVPGDISAAAFFLTAAACLAGSELRIDRVGINPTRAAFLDLLIRLGADIEMIDRRLSSGEPVADLIVRGGVADSNEKLIVSSDLIANLIDEVPVLAVLGTQLKGGLEVRDAKELRVKESDRIKSIVTNLRKMSADVEEFDDGFRVGRSSLKGASVDSFGDHRIAMAFAVAGLFAEGETEIAGADCVAVSFPGFFDVLAEVTET